MPNLPTTNISATRTKGEQASSKADGANREPTAADPPAAGFRSRLVSWWRAARPALPFVSSWALLDVMLNLRYPQQEPALWYLLPSVDVLILFFYFGIFGWNKWRVPTAMRVGLVALIFLVRIIRFGDGIQKRFYFQTFNLYGDLPLVPNLIHFSYKTFPLWKFLLVMVLALAVPTILAVATYRALVCAEKYLADSRRAQRVGLITAVSFLVLSVFPRDPYYAQFYYGGFAASALPRLKHEAKFLLNVYGYTEEKTRAIAAAQERLAKEPSDLAKLHHANVYLILVESYGVATFNQPLLEERSRATFDSFESEVGRRGFSVVSGLLDSPTHGGQSWLAHATLATTIEVADQLQYEIIFTQRPKTMARFFRDAGYRTTLVQPGTTRPWPKWEFYQFENHYFLWDFDYAGPAFSWATMPDQYVLDFVRRHEIEKQRGPLFVQYALVSSHAPWSHLPVVVDDWSRIANGDIYNHLETIRYPITWPDFDNASEAYVHSIMYDFDVLKRYIADYVHDDSLIILLGDHQPVREVSGGDANHGVPVHVISRDKALLEPFVGRGYVPGIRPRMDDERPPMREFLIDFLEDFSTPNANPTR